MEIFQIIKRLVIFFHIERTRYSQRFIYSIKTVFRFKALFLYSLYRNLSTFFLKKICFVVFPLKYASGIFESFLVELVYSISLTDLYTAAFEAVIKTHLYLGTRGPMAIARCHFHYLQKRVSLVLFFPSSYL